MNIFLISVTYTKNTKTIFISDETIKNTVSVLNMNNIKIDENIIPKKIVNLNAIELKNIVFNAKFPKEHKKNDDHTFLYTVDSEIKSELDIKKILSDIGIDKNTHIVYNKDTSRVNLKVKNYTVFDIGLDISQKNGKTQISGNWYINETRSIKDYNVSEIVPITGILIEFANQFKTEDEITIKSIDLGYYIPQSKRAITNVSTSATPCYKILTSNNESYFYNARNGEYLK